MALRSRMVQGEPTNSAADHLSSGPGSLTYQGYLTPIPQFPFYKMAMTILLAPRVVRRSNELIHAKDLEQCLEHSKRISCFLLELPVSSPRYSCQPGLNTTSQRGLPSPGTGTEAVPRPQSLSKVILSPLYGTSMV